MKPEDRLRDAATAYTDPIQPASDAWVRIRGRVDVEPRRPRRSAGRLALAGFATAVVIALVVTLIVVVRDDDGGGRNVVAGPNAAEPPSQIVAVTEDGRMAVLDVRTGSELRQLATGADSGSTVTTTPDGSRIFFDRAVPAATECSSSREIVSVPLAGGDPELVAPAASQPAVSPNGRMLAYLGHGGPSGCSVPQTLVVQPIDDPSARREWSIAGGEAEYLGRVSWARDSRHLAFGVVGSAFPRIIDTETAQSMADANDLELDTGVGWFGYLGRTGEFLGTVVPPEYGVTDDTFRVVAVDESGRVARDLFSATGTVSEPFVSDASGNNVLIRTGPDGDSESLYSWSGGETGLTEVRDGIVAAAWLPGARLPTSGPVPDAPASVVAATRDGRVLVLDAETGDERRVLADGADAETVIAVTTDGERIFFDRPSTTGGPPREIVTVAVRGGEVHVIGGEAAQPAVSPDGTKLAFLRYEGGAEPRALEVVTTASVLGTPERLGYWQVGAPTQQIDRPSWAPDSRHITYTLVDTPQGNYPRTLDTQQDIPLDQAPIVSISDGSRVDGYLGDSGELLGAACVASSEPDQRGRVLAINAESGEEIRQLFRFPEPCGAQRFAADRSGAHVLGAASGELYRWSEGEAEPTSVAEGVVAAAWLPVS